MGQMIFRLKFSIGIIPVITKTSGARGFYRGEGVVKGFYRGGGGGSCKVPRLPTNIFNTREWYTMT